MSVLRFKDPQTNEWIEITTIMGPPGPRGLQGESYILTDTDKAEIAEMVVVDVPDVDLTEYYTKSEIDNLLANMPAGDIPSGEEVGF